mgnify:CR=1 FL=1|tara:strand:- start:7 stop:183 length:177 start_codon:yes stop_codon:yes gene_type:complete
MNITSAKFISPSKFESESSSIKATINGIVMYVPIDTNNIEYQAIQEWVTEGNTIEAAD